MQIELQPLPYLKWKSKCYFNPDWIMIIFIYRFLHVILYVHSEKTELLKKCLSRSYEFHKSAFKVVDIVNKHSDEEIQNALIKAGYQKDKVYNFPKTFYSPYLFTQQFNE